MNWQSAKMKLCVMVTLAFCVIFCAALAEVSEDRPSSQDIELVKPLDSSGLYRPRRVRSYYPGKREYIMYHGTSWQAAESIIQTGFRPSTGGMLGAGVYVTRDIRKAQMFPMNLSANQRVILKLNVRVGKVKKIDYHGHPLQFTWHNHGYDTAWVPPGNTMVSNGLTENCVWDPKRIKILDIVQAPAGKLPGLKDLLKRTTTYHCAFWLPC